MKVAIVGAGWAGMAAACHATLRGHRVHVFEASKTLGGRARALDAQLPDGRPIRLDNGQHILIGAYTATLQLMQQVGVAPQDALLRIPLRLQFPDGNGLQLPAWPSPLDALVGIGMARGWSLSDKWSLFNASLRWLGARFQCAPSLTVEALCQGVARPVMQHLIEPLCVSALNTPAERASAQVFLRVLQDSLFGGTGSSHLLLPRTDLTALFPAAAAHWVVQHGGSVHTNHRIDHISLIDRHWVLGEEVFDAVIWATSSSVAAQVFKTSSRLMAAELAAALQNWARVADALQFEAIATIYTYAPEARLAQPMLALHSSSQHPAQFVFDRGQINGQTGVMAWVVSAAEQERSVLQTAVLEQAQQQLGLQLQALQTVVEKRATFACTPELQRPGMALAPGLLACGDYVAGPYPATLEGAVRSGIAAAQSLHPPY
jgi:hydroxysqualene dehydroxylase